MLTFKGIARLKSCQCTRHGVRRTFFDIVLFASVVIEVVIITIKVIITRNDSTKTRNQRHRKLIKPEP